MLGCWTIAAASCVTISTVKPLWKHQTLPGTYYLGKMHILLVQKKFWGDCVATKKLDGSITSYILQRYIRSRGPWAGPVSPGPPSSATGRYSHVDRPATEALLRILDVLLLFHCRQTPKTNTDMTSSKAKSTPCSLCKRGLIVAQA